MLMYLIHKNNPEKTQYKEEEVQGETNELHKLIQKSIPIEEKTTKIINEINEGHIRSTIMLMYYATANNCIEEVKKLQFLFYKCIEEKWKKPLDKEKE